MKFVAACEFVSQCTQIRIHYKINYDLGSMLTIFGHTQKDI